MKIFICESFWYTVNNDSTTKNLLITEDKYSHINYYKLWYRLYSGTHLLYLKFIIISQHLNYTKSRMLTLYHYYYVYITFQILSPRSYLILSKYVFILYFITYLNFPDYHYSIGTIFESTIVLNILGGYHNVRNRVCYKSLNIFPSHLH